MVRRPSESWHLQSRADKLMPVLCRELFQSMQEHCQLAGQNFQL